MKDFEQWHGFKGSKWRDDINTRDFILNNYTPYDGDESFLEGPTDATNKLGQAARASERGTRQRRRFGYGYTHCNRTYRTQTRLYR